MTTSDNTIDFIGLYDIEWFINNKSVIIPENSAIAIHDNNSERDFFIFGDGKSAIGELELREIGLEPFPKHSLDFELIEQKNRIISSVKEIISNAIDDAINNEMKSCRSSDPKNTYISIQRANKLFCTVKENIFTELNKL